MRTPIVATLACLLGASQLALAQTPAPYVSSVRKSLDASVEGRNLTPLAPSQVDALREDETSTFTFEVPTDANISVRAVCDAECTDINLEVASVSGAILGEDTEDDAVPQVNLSASQHAKKLVVTVSINSCYEDDDSCSIAVGVYQR